MCVLGQQLKTLSNACAMSRKMAVQYFRCSKAVRNSDVIWLTCSMVPCFSLKPNVGTVLFILRWGLIRKSSIFSNNFDRQVSKLISLYYNGCVLSFPGFGIITMVKFFHFGGKYPSFAIVLNNRQMCRIAHFGISMSIFGVIKSQAGYSFDNLC